VSNHDPYSDSALGTKKLLSDLVEARASARKINWNLLFNPKTATSLHPDARTRYDEMIFNRNSPVDQRQVPCGSRLFDELSFAADPMWARTLFPRT
jgi:hypothetical protein